MSVLVNEGRAAIASAIAEMDIHLAWGTGEDSWGDTPPAPDKATATLVNEVGRRQLTEWSFVVPDENGDIITTTGKFTRSNSAQPSVLLSFKYDYDNAPNDTIREVAVFINSQMIAGLPDGQRYFTPDQVADGGLMLSLEYLYIPRTPSSRETLDMVITF